VMDEEQGRGKVRPSRMRHCGVNGASLPDSNHNMILTMSEIGPKVVFLVYKTVIRQGENPRIFDLD
jgi:hypothetical protein